MIMFGNHWVVIPNTCIRPIPIQEDYVFAAMTLRRVHEPVMWENYQVDAADDKPTFMAQAPMSEGGKHYEVLNQRS